MENQHDLIRLSTNEETSFIPNPYKFPELVWEFVYPFVKKYGYDFSEYAPQVEVKNNVVRWRVRQLKLGNSKGMAKFPRFVGNYQLITDDGKIGELYQTVYTLNFEYLIYSNDNNALDLAWDLQVIVERSRDLFHLNSLQIEFIQATQSLVELKGSPYRLTTLEFRAEIPTYQMNALAILHQIEIVGSVQIGTVPLAPFVYNNEEKYLILAADPLYTVSSIQEIVILNGTSRQLLEKGIDYEIEPDVENKGIYIVWLANGAKPDGGQTFWVSYGIALQTIY